MRNHRRQAFTLLILPPLLALFLQGCSGFLKPHKLTIQQGNIVTREMLDKVKLGMTPSQVKYILGTPLVVDTFDNNKWYYLYSLRLGTGQALRQKLAVNFADGELASFDSDYQFDLPGQRGGTPTAMPETARPETAVNAAASATQGQSPGS
ncbi:MAG: outer membrane protein assembly factor BamE [Pseudomonadales bacterium]